MNLFAYCGNNPVSYADHKGEWANIVIGAVVGGLVGGITAAMNGGDAADIALSVFTGAIGGAIGATGLCAVGQAIASGVLSAASNIGSALIHGRKVDVSDVATDFVIGAASSFVGSAVTKKAADAASKTVSKGINRIVSGKGRYDAGSRYWKGAIKRGVKMVTEGVRNLNVARGKASVIGSLVGGLGSVSKNYVKDRFFS